MAITVVTKLVLLFAHMYASWGEGASDKTHQNYKRI